MAIRVLLLWVCILAVSRLRCPRMRSSLKAVCYPLSLILLYTAVLTRFVRIE